MPRLKPMPQEDSLLGEPVVPWDKLTPREQAEYLEHLRKCQAFLYLVEQARLERADLAERLSSLSNTRDQDCTLKGAIRMGIDFYERSFEAAYDNANSEASEEETLREEEL